MSSFDIYLLLKVIPTMGIMLGALSVGVMAVCIINIVNGKDDENCTASFVTGCVFFLFFLMSFFVPSQKEMAVIYLAPKIANNQIVQQIPADIVKFIEKQIGSEADSK